MRKLLRADFSRLFRDKLFYALIALMMLWEGLVLSEGNRLSREFLYETKLDDYAFSWFQIFGILFSVFVCLFLGREYSDGTIRNKLVVGHGRLSIYFAGLITVIAAGLMLCAGALLIACGVGIPLMGAFTAEPEQLLFLCLCSVLVVISYSAIFTLMGMLCSRKAVTAILCVLTAFGLMLFASYLNSSLSQPEMLEQYISEPYVEDGAEAETGSGGEPEMEEEPQYDENGRRVTLRSEWVKNPRYLTGMKREAYQFLFECLPGGQSYLISGFEVEEPWRLMGYSALLAVAVSGAGCLVFRRKDIK